MDFDLKLEPNGSFAILTNYKDVTLTSVIERQRAMKMFAEEYGVDCPALSGGYGHHVSPARLGELAANA
jgi:hypothetical protein